MNNKYLIGLAVAIVIAIGGYQFPQVQTEVREVFGAFPGGTILSPLELEGGVTYGNVNATSTLADMTLRVGDVQGYDTVVVSPTGAASAKTLTFFASSTAPSWLPRTGDMQTTCFVNSTTTSAVNVDFVGGTGIVLLHATSTSGGIGAPTIAPNDVGCFRFIRGASTASTFDIYAAFVEYKDAD